MKIKILTLILFFSCFTLHTQRLYSFNKSNIAEIAIGYQLDVNSLDGFTLSYTFPQDPIKASELIGMYKFDLTRTKDYLIKIFKDGTLTGQAVPRGINVNYSDYQSPLDHGSWKIISHTQFQIYWSDIPKWTCTVTRNDKNQIIGFIEDSKTFVERISLDPKSLLEVKSQTDNSSTTSNSSSSSNDTKSFKAGENPYAKEYEEAFMVVQEPPTFPGGREELTKFVSQNLIYPKEAKDNGIKGKVFTSFIIEPDGKVTYPYIIKGIGGGCDEEALRVIKSMPDWIPGKQNGTAVHVQFNLPIEF